MTKKRNHETNENASTEQSYKNLDEQDNINENYSSYRAGYHSKNYN